MVTVGRGGFDVAGELETALITEIAAEVQHREYTILEGLGSFGDALRFVIQSPDHTNTLGEDSLGDFLRLMTSVFEGKKTLKDEANQVLWRPVIIVRNERREKRERYAGRARYTSRRKLLMKHLPNNGEPVWAPSTDPAMYVRLSWLAAVLQLGDNGRNS